MNETLKLLHAHRSIRKFSDQALSAGQLERIISAGQCAATSSFLQGATIIRVSNPDLRRAGNCCERYEKPFSGDYTEHFIIATVDAALLAQNVVVAAESEGLGICYIGGLRNNPREVSDLLQLPKGVYPVFGLCLGYPDQNPEVKPRLPLEVILKQETYNDEGDAALIETYDEQVREYYRTRTGGGHGICWSEQVASLLSEKARPHMRGFLADQGFNFK